eukprot:TRINITY_DN7794_c0_g1_i1.p1 TRINITY_DN7794_c0_g1~~TRINITY_DN7794_c0_g1_i1.p1  ORF type:complete len:449 (+),score=199.62 TRINITY_DN7794_c0_g1_i1:50-1396(+)
MEGRDAADPLHFEEQPFACSHVRLASNPLFMPPPAVLETDAFLDRFRLHSALPHSVDDAVEEASGGPPATPALPPVDMAGWEEVVTIASAEDIEKQRKAMPLEELLQRQDLPSTFGEEEGKGKEVRVDKWGFVIEEDDESATHTTPVEDTKKKDAVEAARAEKWVEVVSKWDSYSSDKKKKMKQKFRKMGIPDRLRGMMWKKLADVAVLRDENPNLFKRLLEDQSDHDGQIQRDIHRTFPKHIFFREQGGMGQTALFNTLKAYAIYDKKVGYCQGMGFIIALLLLYMTEEDAFYILVRLCRDYEMSGLFEPGFPGLMKFFFMHDHLFEQIMPNLFMHFDNEGIRASMYSHDWYTTVFSSLPFPYVIRIFDVFLAEGARVLFRVSLALLKSMAGDLVTLDLEGIMERLKNISKYVTVSPDEIINIAMSFKIPSKKIERLEKEYEQGGGM